MKILFVVNSAGFFISHRLPLGLEAQARGHEVVVASAPGTGEEALAEYGIRHIAVPMSRSGFVPAEEHRTYRALRHIYKAAQPDLVHHVTIKPVIYGSLAARSVNVPAVVNAVPGMGFVFTRWGVRAAVGRALVNFMYRVAFSHPNMRVIFQNGEDLRGFIGHGIVRKEESVLIRGSGVDLSQFEGGVEPAGPMTFLLVARMLRDKGIVEFAGAAAQVRQRHPDWRFVLAGDVDEGNPTSLREAELRRLEADFGVEWIGHCDEISDLMARSHVVCLPTFYREGVPKALLEASAAARPMIASDIAGCREVVTDGVTGLLVPTRAVQPLAEAMLRMGEDPEFRQRCGRAARHKAEAVFSVADVVEHTFRVYAELLPE